jgi:hypothetical protein
LNTADKGAHPELETDVVVAVFQEFIQNLLQDTSVDRGIVERLRVALLEKQDTSADKLRAALFSEDSAL